MRGEFVVNGKEMSQKQFAIWIGKAINKSMAHRLKDKGYSTAKIAELMDVKENTVLHYLKED